MPRMLGVLAVLLTTAAFAAEPAAVTLETVKYPELCKAVRAQRGKVVVVDVWADFCVPCKREFPHLVEMHKKYAKDGLVCMSVAVDEAKQKPAALAFLQKQEATFANYLLDEEFDYWQNKFDINGPPAVFVFDRNNKRAGKFDYTDPNKQFTYADVEKLVQQLLKDEAPAK